ncbi:MAG: hypothetical protein V4534_05065 [Myxococcota bacterium]
MTLYTKLLVRDMEIWMKLLMTLVFISLNFAHASERIQTRMEEYATEFKRIATSETITDEDMEKLATYFAPPVTFTKYFFWGTIPLWLTCRSTLELENQLYDIMRDLKARRYKKSEADQWVISLNEPRNHAQAKVIWKRINQHDKVFEILATTYKLVLSGGVWKITDLTVVPL